MQEEKRNDRTIKALKTKNKIYEEATKLIRKHGFENVSVDSIVEAAGVSKGAFYVHFDSKDALAVDMINEYTAEVDMDYKSFVESFDANTAASEILNSLIGKIADILNDTIGYDNMKALYKAQITKAIKTDAVIGYARDLYKIFDYVISKGVEQGEFRRDIPVDIITKHCLLAIRGLTYEWCIRYPDFDLKEQALKHFEILLTGIRK